MALGNDANPIIKDSEPTLKTTKWGSIDLSQGSQKTSLDGIYSGGDAARGGSTAIRAAGDGQAAAREILGNMDLDPTKIHAMVDSARSYTEQAATPQTILKKVQLTDNIVEFIVHSPMIARAARAGQFVRVLPWANGELIPLCGDEKTVETDWDAGTGDIWSKIP